MKNTHSENPPGFVDIQVFAVELAAGGALAGAGPASPRTRSFQRPNPVPRYRHPGPKSRPASRAGPRRTRFHALPALALGR